MNWLLGAILCVIFPPAMLVLVPLALMEIAAHCVAGIIRFFLPTPRE